MIDQVAGDRSSRVRLLHVLYSGQGGLGTYFLEFVASDKNQRFAHSAVFYGVEELYPEYERFVRDREIPYTSIRKHRGPDLIAALQLLRAVAQPADAIVLHSSAAAASVLLRSVIAPCAVLHVEHATPSAKTLRDKVSTFLLRRYSDRTVAFYPEHARQLSSAADRVDDRVVVIAKNPDVSFFRPAEASRAHNDIRVGMHARLSVHKDHSTLLRAFAIAREASALPLSLHIVGDGAQRDRLEQLALELDLSGSVVFHGMLERDPLRALLQSLDIYVHATHGETQCYAIMEAQASGLPVAASDVSGVRDVIEEGLTGLLFPHEDAGALAELLLRLSTDPTLRTDLGRRARQYVVRRAEQLPTAEAFYDVLLQVRSQ